jgi:hypothetical protein
MANQKTPPARRSWVIRWRLWQMLFLLSLFSLPMAWFVGLRQRVAQERQAIHTAQMLGSSVTETPPEETPWTRFCTWSLGRAYPQEVRLSFQNLGKHAHWGPYGEEGKLVELHAWEADQIRRLGPALQQLPGLKQLSFWNSPLPSNMLAEILPASSELRYLNLLGSPVSRVDMAALRRVPNLQRLILTNTDVTDEDMDFVAGLPELACLHLEDTRVTDAGLARMASLRKLEEVNLGLTRVTSAAIPTLARWQVTTLLIVPAEWSEQEVAELQQAVPVGCEVRRSMSEFRHFPGAKAAADSGPG